MTRSLLDDLGLHLGPLGALARHAVTRRQANDLADAELAEGLWAEPEPGQAAAPLIRMAADTGEAGRYVTDPPLLLADGSQLRVSLEPTADGAWVLTAERLGGDAAGRGAVSVRVIPAADSAPADLHLPAGEVLAAELVHLQPGEGISILAELEG